MVESFANQLRVAGMGSVMGFDIQTLIKVLEINGHACPEVLDLLSACEAGFTEALSDNRRE